MLNFAVEESLPREERKEDQAVEVFAEAEIGAEVEVETAHSLTLQMWPFV